MLDRRVIIKDINKTHIDIQLKKIKAIDRAFRIRMKIELILTFDAAMDCIKEKMYNFHSNINGALFDWKNVITAYRI